MRYWRGESFTRGIPRSSFNTGLKLWAWVARRPHLYRKMETLAARLMRMIAGKNGHIRSLPVLTGWFVARDLAKPAKESFQSQWQKRQ